MQDSTVTISGIVVESESDSIGLPYVHIINKTQGKGTISDEEGIFSIKVQKGDSIEFSFIGFDDYYLMADSNAVLVIQLEVDAQLLQEQIVRPLPTSLNALRQAMSNLELADKTDTLITNMAKAGFKRAPENPSVPKANTSNILGFLFQKIGQKIKEKKHKEPTKMF